MIKLRLIQPGMPDELVTIEGATAVIGRNADCDLTILQPYVSKRHTKILRGTIVVDLKSRNGTFVGGTRITEPVVLEGGSIKLGDGDAIVEVLEASDPAAAEPEPFEPEGFAATIVADSRPAAPTGASEVARDLEEMRSRATASEMEVQRLRRELAAAKDTTEKDSVLADLSQENADLRRRLESLKAELEEGAAEAAEDVAAKLARDELDKVRARNEELTRRVAELEARPLAPAAPGPSGAAAPDPEAETRRKRIAELEEQNREHQRNARRLEDELAQARARLGEVGEKPAPQNVSDLFFRVQKENSELRKKVDELERSGAGKGAPELFFRLQAENQELRNKVAVLEAGGSSAAAPEATSGLEERVAAQAGEIERLTAELAQARSVPSAPAQAPSPAPRARPLPPSSGAGESVRNILHRFVDEDADQLPRTPGEPAEDFVFTETLRYLRQVERVVTRMAGSFIQLYELNTMLPDMESNFRGLVTEVLANPEEDAVREELVKYLEEMRKWLVVSLGAQRRAATRFADELKVDLSERGLTSRAPIPRYKKLAGHDAELWKRARKYLKELTPEVMEDRLDRLARESAHDLLAAQQGL